MESTAQLFDTSFLATIFLILVVTFIAGLLRSRRRDVCLASFDDYHVTVERENGKHIWGKLDLAATGLELIYRDSVQDLEHVESSYILYTEEFNSIQTIYRYADRLSPENKARRAKDIDEAVNPTLSNRIARHLCHFTSMASGALSEVFGLFIGRMRQPAGRYITDTGETHLKQLGSSVIGYVGHEHDPLLERYIGQRVVVELLESDGEIHEHVGILQNYSADFIELLDVQFPQKQALLIQENDDQIRAKQDTSHLHVKSEGEKLKVWNHGAFPVLLQSMGEGENEELLDVLIDGGDFVELYPKNQKESTSLHIRTVRELDMIVPRTRCLVRHGAGQAKKLILPEIIFDLGVTLQGRSKLNAQEERLRKEIESNPNAILAMANLGSVLMKKEEYEEAATWLEKAYKARRSLPDSGRRSQMLLNELERKRKRSPIDLPDESIVLSADSTGQLEGAKPKMGGQAILV
ncbi:MAG: hypothetical protein AAF702_18060 [Chloroflexota bacterium]